MHAMQSSASEHSYAHHSGAQNFNFHSLAKPRLSEALKRLVCSTCLNSCADATGAGAGACAAPSHGGMLPHRFAVADLGCSHGRNTLDCAEFVVRTLLENLASRIDNEASCHNVMEIQFYFSDLPSNDFNSLFQSLKPYLYQSDSGSADTQLPLPKFFAAGVPGSFYGRLFPTASLDLVICSHSLHWLSQVPPSLVDKTSPAWNGGHTWISKTKPSKAVADAYARQSEKDIRTFLRHRAEELRSGGILFLLWSATSGSSWKGEESTGSAAVSTLSFENALGFLDEAWKEMVDEGRIASEEMDMYNLMLYFLNQQELEGALKDVPKWRVLHMESINNMGAFAEQGDRTQTVEQWVGMLASTIKPGVEAHVGKSRADELFQRLKTICLNQECFQARLTHTAVITSLQRL